MAATKKVSRLTIVGLESKIFKEMYCVMKYEISENSCLHVTDYFYT